MSLSSVFILVGLVLVAFGISYYHYLYKVKSKSNTVLLLAFLRFCSVFTLLLLLWNPFITTTKYSTEKTPLPIIIDNSTSLTELKAGKQAQTIYKQLKESKALSSKFAVQFFQVDTACKPLSELTLLGKQSRLDEAGKQLKLVYRNQKFPTIFMSDGNQTAGNDFVYSFEPSNPVYPVIVGDTLPYFDLKVDQVNVNKYAFYQNKFPVEVMLSHSGLKDCTAQLNVTLGKKVVYTESIAFQANQKSKWITFLLPASALGTQLFQATVFSTKLEKNKTNNTKKFPVEVLDQRRNVTLVSAINHPDISALKRAIEHNGQSKVTLCKPNEYRADDKANVIILYQPTARFAPVFAATRNSKTPYWIISGMQTDFGFLNQQQSDVNCKMSGQPEYFIPQFNAQFSLFATDDLGFDQFPPLQHPFGTISAARTTTAVLTAKVQGVDTQQPLLCFASGAQRAVYLFGENMWKWRMHYHVRNQSYDQYDVFVDKIIQYLATNESKKSLVVSHENYYNAGDDLSISAQYFDKNYAFDEKAQLQLEVRNKQTKATKTLEMLKQSNYFKANLDGLPAGTYSFTVKEAQSNSTYIGSFEVLDFEIEKQFINPNRAQMEQLALQTNAKTYYPSQIDQLIDKLIEDNQYKAIQKETIQKTPLLDWVYLLLLLVSTFAAEWFIRKYNGLL